MMNDRANELQLWQATDQVTIPTKIDQPGELAEYGSATLSRRDIVSITRGFEAESYEMVSAFIWTKAAAVLKRQVATLGMEFVGEMLGRPDLNEDSDPAKSLGDHEAIALAEDLGMVTTMQALRLKHALELVSHFSVATENVSESEQMQREEAILLLRTCITSILGKPKFDVAIEFAKFRDRLTRVPLKASDGDVQTIKASPYFFVRTTLSVLLAALRTSEGAALEHAVGNAMELIPALWVQTREPERWQIGQKYAEVSADGNRIAAAGLKRALMCVRGFDYVPESLRSNSFTEAAAAVLTAHFEMNNYFREQKPMEALAALGTSIPRPALAKVLEATLAVYLGNAWGFAWGAQAAAKSVIQMLRPAQWSYYLDECLSRDRTILEKLAEQDKPRGRWCELARSLDLGDYRAKDKSVSLLWTNSCQGESAQSLAKVSEVARGIRAKFTS